MQPAPENSCSCWGQQTGKFRFSELQSLVCSRACQSLTPLCCRQIQWRLQQQWLLWSRRASLAQRADCEHHTCPGASNISPKRAENEKHSHALLTDLNQGHSHDHKSIEYDPNSLLFKPSAVLPKNGPQKQLLLFILFGFSKFKLIYKSFLIMLTTLKIWNPFI